MTTSLSIAMPAVASACAEGAGVCARAVTANIRRSNGAQAFRPARPLPFMENPLCDQQRQPADDARQRHRRAVATIRFEQIRHLTMARRQARELQQVDVADEPESAFKRVLEDDFMSADDRPALERQAIGKPQIDRWRLLETFEHG